jgi:putative PEP-CTERM system TPR-repeat lipoprotein
MLAAVHLHQGRYVEARRSLDAIRADLHDASYHLIAGELALRQKQHDKAAKHFEEAARLKPGDATILTELGIARLGSGDPRGQTSLESAIALPGGGERAGAVLILDHLHNKRFDHALASIAEMERKQGASPLTSNYRGAALLGKKDRIRARESFTEALKRDPAFYPSAANLAQLDLLDKQPAAARKRFEDVLKADPRQLDAMLALARLARDNDTAMRWLQKAVQAHPTAVEPRLDMARLLFAAKQASQALTQAREALGLSPNNPVALELLGTIQFALGDHPNAIGTLRRLVEISPASSAARIKLARIQIAADQTADARRSLMDTLRTHPESLDAQALLVQLDLKEARYDEARKRAIAIQTAHPHAAIGFQLLGAVSLARQQPAEALTAFERAHTLTPKTDTLIQQHTALILLDRRNESEIRLAAWLKSRPGDNVARGALAESLLHSGHNKLAASQYRELNRKIPNNPTVLNNLAWASYAAGDPSALAFAEQALKARPDDASIMDTLGWILTNRNQTARGIAVLQQAQSRAPDSPEIQWHLASAFARAGNQTRARSELRRLLDSEVPFSQRDAARALLKTLETGTH